MTPKDAREAALQITFWGEFWLEPSFGKRLGVGTPNWGLLLLIVLVGLTAGCDSETELHWNQEENFRWAAVDPGFWGDAGFSRREPSRTGIHFENRLTEEEVNRNQHYMNGSGVAAGDVNGDGWTDLYFARLNGPNQLYENRGGFEFVDVTDSAGVAHSGHYSTGVVLEDIDGDEDLDLLVGSIARGISIYLNDGNGHFSRRSGALEVGKGNMTMALADVDGDADLDLYVANYKEKTVKDLYDRKKLTWENTVRRAESGTGYEVRDKFDEHYTIIRQKNAPDDRRETGELDALYLNNGDGIFQKVDETGERFVDAEGRPTGLSPDWGLNASFHDINRDGHPDLYVNNDFWTPDRVWIGQGDGTFQAIDSLAIRSSSFSSMTVDFTDFNRDGHLDFFVTEMLSPKHQRRLRQFVPDDPFPTTNIGSRPQYNENSLYLNRGDGTYAEIANFSGVDATEWSWATRFLDVDLDANDDLLINTGFSYDYQDLDSQFRLGQKMARTPGSNRFLTEYPTLQLKNKALQNASDLTFSERGRDWGFADEKDVSHGMATADFDHDGDLDLAISRLNDKALLYENEVTAPRITVQLEGAPPNVQAIGAKVRLEGGPGNTPQQEEMTSGGDYLSDSVPTVTFAADPNNPNHVLSVTWPDRTTTIVDSVGPNRIYDIKKPSSSGHPSASNPQPQESESSRVDRRPVFEDISGKISHRHHESRYNDFNLQPLLPIRLSQEGPGISWIDYDSDGDDDLFIAAGRGGGMAVYENDADGTFVSRSIDTMSDPVSGDQTTILGWPTGEGTQFWIGRANLELEDPGASSGFRYLLQDGAVVERDSLPGIRSTTGPLAAADYDGDGDLDLFVGGRFVPARYPKDATSRLFENEENHFELDKSAASKLQDSGLVTGAVFTDYDLDGDPDLLISRAWDTLKLYRNDEGTFQDVTEEVGLDQHAGWWNGVATGDFNNDGRPDIIATNWGRNSIYQLDSERPLKMYYGDLNNDRRTDIIEAYYESSLGSYVPRRQLMAFERAKVSYTFEIETHTQFANASLRKILGFNPERRLSAKEINTVAHTLFLNEGDQFLARSLPDRAQFSTAFDASVADYNNDGKEDLFISQNFFDVRSKMPRLDAGRGLWLRGNGDGTFEVVPGHVSGIEVYGEQRGAALADYDGDGRVDLAVTQNGAATKLYKNQTSETGLIIRLVGPVSNRDGIGCSVRLLYENGDAGPRREIQAGSGYWSQDSPTQVLGYSKRPRWIEVTWFDGQVDSVKVRGEKLEYELQHTSGPA